MRRTFLILTIAALFGAPNVFAVTRYTLTVTKSGTGTGTITSSKGSLYCGTTCSWIFKAGTKLMLNQSASSTSVFAGWSGACSGTSCSLTMNANKAVGGTFNSAAVVTVSVTPSSATLLNTATQQFAATVTGTTNTSVTWSCPACSGSLSISGLYTAPVSGTGTDTVIACSVADSSKCANASANIIGAFGHVYSVKAGGGGDFTTIQACATFMVAGDFCTVYAGTYNENVTLPAGGVGAYKTLQVNGSDVVYVLSVFQNSHTKIIGFHIQNPSSPTAARCVTWADTGIDMWAVGNNMYACNTPRAQTSASGRPTFVVFRNNTISYPCATSNATPINACSALSTSGDHWLIEGNDFSHNNDVATLSSSYTVFRKNYIHDLLTAECTFLSGSTNCHYDIAQTEPGFDVKHTLIEANYGGNNQGGFDAQNSTINGHGFLMQANVCPAPTIADPYPCSHYIIRENALLHVAGGGVVDNLDANNMGYTFVKVYNNDWLDFNYDSPLFGATNGHAKHAFNSSEVNNIFFYPFSQADFNPYFFDSTSTGADYGYNLGWCTLDGSTIAPQCVLWNHVYSTGHQAFVTDPGNILANPLFTSYTVGSTSYGDNDFTLQSLSPAKNAGRAHTTVTSATGTLTSVSVVDASFFQDGWGMTSAGVLPDWIAFGCDKTRAQQIASIDYATNIITLAAPMAVTSGEGVCLYKDSSGDVVPGLSSGMPNIGAK